MTTFIEKAATAQEMRDKICEWLEDRAVVAKQNAVRAGNTITIRKGYEREIYCYGEAARFWRSVTITAE